MSFDNKVIIVTGASSGIGAEIAKQFAKEGAKVAIVGRNEQRLNNVAETIGKLGSKSLQIVADLSKDQDVQRILDSTISHFGKLDVLVNNAGVAAVGSITDKDVLPGFDNVMAVNLRSVVMLTNIAAPYLIASKGNIINISSVVSSGVMSSNTFAYCTSKAALDHFTRCAALDFAKKGVRCNSVNPGPVKTDMPEKVGLNEVQLKAIRETMKESTALKRFSEPQEVADVVLFLASDKAKAVTGSSYVVDNGAIVNGGLKISRE